MEQAFIKKKFLLLKNQFYSAFDIDYITFCISNKGMVDYLISKIEEQFPSFKVYVKTNERYKNIQKQKDTFYDVSVYPFETDYGTFWKVCVMGKNADPFFHCIFFNLPGSFFQKGTITLKRIDIKYRIILQDEIGNRDVFFVRKSHEDFLDAQTLFIEKKETAFPCVYVGSMNKYTTSLGERDRCYYIRICSNLDFDYIEFELKKHTIKNLNKAFQEQKELVFFYYLIEKLHLCSTRFVKSNLTYHFLELITYFTFDRRFLCFFLFQKPEITKKHNFLVGLKKEINYQKCYDNKIVFYPHFLCKIPPYPRFLECFQLIVWLYYSFFDVAILDQSFYYYVNIIDRLAPIKALTFAFVLSGDFFDFSVPITQLAKRVYGSSSCATKKNLKENLISLSQLPFNPNLSYDYLPLNEEPLIKNLVFEQKPGQEEKAYFTFNVCLFWNLEIGQYYFCVNYYNDFYDFFKKNCTKKTKKIKGIESYIFFHLTFLIQDNLDDIPYEFLFCNETRFEKKQEILEVFFIILSFFLEKELINSYSFDNNFFISHKISFKDFKIHIKKNSKEKKIFIKANFQEKFKKLYVNNLNYCPF